MGDERSNLELRVGGGRIIFHPGEEIRVQLKGAIEPQKLEVAVREANEPSKENLYNHENLKYFHPHSIEPNRIGGGKRLLFSITAPAEYDANVSWKQLLSELKQAESEGLISPDVATSIREDSKKVLDILRDYPTGPNGYYEVFARYDGVVVGPCRIKITISSSFQSL